MPEILRAPLRMDCAGICLTKPLDRMQPGEFPYLFNVRVLEEGRLESRPGYTTFISPNDIPNSIRRLNDEDRSFAAAGYIYVGGGGPNLYAGPESTYTIVAGGFSGDPLSLIPFRPEQSSESWMYVYDRLKNTKVRPDGAVRDIGVAPPSYAPGLAYGVPAQAIITEGFSAGPWVSAGTSGAQTTTTRTVGGPITIAQILYDSGATGWACVDPIAAGGTSFSWLGERMRLVFDSGGGNEETVTVREIHPVVKSTTIAGINYDAGSTGLCTLVLTDCDPSLARNSLIVLNGTEVVRVLAVILAPDGITYCIRCSTVGTFTAGQSVDGMLSLYLYATKTHVATETITVNYVDFTQTTGTGTGTLTAAVDGSRANGRPISPANDWFHCSIYLSSITLVTDVTLLINLDTASAFVGNYWQFKLNVALLGTGWNEIILPISSGTHIGTGASTTFASINNIRISVTTTGNCHYGLDAWYFFGTYGPEVQPNSPVGITYISRFRDSTTGAHSVPGPALYPVFPLREEVLVTPATTTASGVDMIDIYRLGGSVTQYLYVGSVTNNNATPQTYADTLPDSVLLQTNQPADFSVLQPWTLLDLPWSGTVNVVGRSVRWASGTKFNLNLVANTVILINGVAYQTFGQPLTDQFLRLSTSAGVLTGATFQIASPQIAAQPLPFAFGPLEGPFAPVVFALGDPINSGTLYWANTSDADAAADTNSLELCGPSEPLISGADWNGSVFVGSRDNVYLVRYSFLSNPSAYQDTKIPAPSGMWSRWTCCSTPIGVAYLGRDGIYVATEQGAVNISDAALYPLFPHDGQPAEQISFGDSIILPVNMSLSKFLRLAYCDQDLLFSYIDIGGNSVTMRYEIPKRRWFPHSYGDKIWTHYLVEGSTSLPAAPQMLLLSWALGKVYLSGGNTDAGVALTSLVLTPSLDGGDERAQKLYVDSMTQADGLGALTLAASYDNALTFSPVLNIPCMGTIIQTLQNLSSLADLRLYRNIGAKFAWTGGPDGPRIYAWEPAGYLQPYLSTFMVTQFINLSFPAWKHHRRLYAGLISTAPVLFTIKTQDDRVYGPYSLPSTGGQYRILPLMLDQAIKDLAFAYQLDGQGTAFALFPESFTIETKAWDQPSYIDLAVFKT